MGGNLARRRALLIPPLTAGTGQIHLSEVQCLGSEKSLWSCPRRNVTRQDCKHSEDAGVRCNVPYMAYETSVGWTVGVGRGGAQAAQPWPLGAAPEPGAPPPQPQSGALARLFGREGSAPHLGAKAVQNPVPAFRWHYQQPSAVLLEGLFLERGHLCWSPFLPCSQRVIAICPC